MTTHPLHLAGLTTGQIYIAVTDFQIESLFETATYNAYQGDRIQISGIFPNGALVYNLNADAGFFVPKRRIGELFVTEALEKDLNLS
uniref:Uncharacterized protein n=1 Tax=Loigolactobacillus rennini TaxID=238013 RepID=A0A1K2I6A9_9LACO|nr:hypothetical protein LREN565_0400 [Loigolactobacillus rennini]